MNRGYTLIELLAFLAVFSLVIIGLTGTFVAMLNVNTRQSAASEVNQQSQFLLQQMQYYVSAARIVDMPQDSPTSTLVLRSFTAGQDPISIRLDNGAVYLQQGAAAIWTPLTSSQVLVSQFLVTRHYNSSTSSLAYGTESVSFSFTMSATSTNNAQYSRTFQSSAVVSAPVPKIAMIQRTRGDSFTNAIDATYPTNNQSGSLLLAVITVAGAPLTSLSDTAGNTWSLLASSSCASCFNTKLNLFGAWNAKSGSNKVSGQYSFAGGVTSLFIFEYRGASTSSPLDVSSTAYQLNLLNPSSGLVSPTSTLELLFGATAPRSTTGEVPSVGPGFMLEASSASPLVFIEDAVRYITEPVEANWQYFRTPAPDSISLIATFK